MKSEISAVLGERNAEARDNVVEAQDESSKLAHESASAERKAPGRCHAHSKLRQGRRDSALGGS